MVRFNEDEVYDALGIEPQREMSFGGDGEGLVDVLDRADIDTHERGLHDEYRAGCPLCESEQSR